MGPSLLTAPLERGTRITLSLKDEAKEYAEGDKLSQLVKTYSEFISFPIKVWKEKQVPRQETDEVATNTARAEAKAKAEAEGAEFDESTIAEVTKTVRTSPRHAMPHHTCSRKSRARRAARLSGRCVGAMCRWFLSPGLQNTACAHKCHVRSDVGRVIQSGTRAGGRHILAQPSKAAITILLAYPRRRLLSVLASDTVAAPLSM